MGNICYSYSEDTFANAKPFVPQITEGRVVKVYDGDTITIVAKLPYKDSEYYRFSVRLLGIDTAEMKSVEKDRATRARDALSARILHLFAFKMRKGFVIPRCGMRCPLFLPFGKLPTKWAF